MTEEIKLQITETGTIRSIYKDGLSQEIRDLLGAKMVVNRASNVEWEEIDGKGGWTVRAANDPELAIRQGSWEGFPTMTLSKDINFYKKVYMFETREEALKAEVRYFWE